MDKDNEINHQNNEETGVIIELPVEAVAESKAAKVRRPVGKARLSGFAYGIIVILLLMVVYVIADISSGGFIYTANGRFQSSFATDKSADFDVDINALKVYAFDRYDDGFMLLTENGVSFIDKNGKTVSGQQLVYSTLSCEANGNNFAFFDRGNQSYTLMKNNTVKSQKKIDNKIIDFAVSQKNNYAVVVRDNTKSVLLGYDSRDEVIYQWDCPKGYITDVTINDSGSKVVASVLNSVNAVLSSKVYILDFEYDTAYAEFEYAGETVLGTKFLSDKKILVLTDKNIYRINAKEQEIIYSYGASDIAYSSFSDKYAAVVTKDYTHEDSYILTVISNSGKIKYTVNLTGKVCGLSVSDKSTAVLYDDKTETYSVYGKLVGSITGLKHFEGIVINKNFIYVLGTDSVKRISAYGMNAYETIIPENETA